MGELGPGPIENNETQTDLSAAGEAAPSEVGTEVEKESADPVLDSSWDEVVNKYGLAEGDQAVVSELSGLDTHVFGASFHNFFNTHREESQQELEAVIAELEAKPELNAHSSQMLEASKLFRQLIENRGWHACYVVERQLEEL